MRPRPYLPLLAALAACTGSSTPPPPPIEHGNPAGYRVHSLSGASLSARTATVNEVGMDTSSVESIDASAQAMIDSAGTAPRTVEEVSGEPAEVTVDFTAPAVPVPATFHGVDIQWRSKFFLSNPRWRALVKQMKVGLIRFPGGQERVKYVRAAHTGTPATDTLTVTADQPYEYLLTGEDVAAFIGLCDELGIEAEPEVNLANDDGDMWRDMVDQIVNELGYDLKYVSVGNEPDIRSPNGNWPYYGAPNVESEANRTIALNAYVSRYLSYQPRLAGVQPGMTYAYGELGMWSPDQLGKNLDAILGGLGANHPGAISDHWYMLGDYGQSSASPDYPSIGHLAAQDSGGRNEIAYLQTIADGMRARRVANGQPDAKLFLGEWGVSWSATAADGAVSDRLAAALFNAEAQERGKLAGFDAMQWFGLSDPSNTGNWVPSLISVDEANGGQPTPRPQWFVYFLYQHLYGDRIVHVTGGLHADWSIHAATDAAGRSYLMLVNRTASTRFTPVVEATTGAGTRQLRLTIYPHSVTIVSF